RIAGLGHGGARILGYDAYVGGLGLNLRAARAYAAGGNDVGEGTAGVVRHRLRQICRSARRQRSNAANRAVEVIRNRDVGKDKVTARTDEDTDELQLLADIVFRRLVHDNARILSHHAYVGGL